MADFPFDFDHTTVTLEVWEDPGVSSPRDLPSRLNPNAAYPHTRAIGTTGVPVVFIADEGPGDVSLGGELYTALVVEAPTAPPHCTGLPGQSSIQSFTPTAAGHYTIFMTRQGAHGGIYAHVDVRD